MAVAAGHGEQQAVRPSARPARVLVAGGGVAGLEALLALRDLAGDQVRLTLLSAAGEFVHRPMATAEPFGCGHSTSHPLAELAGGVGAELVRGRLAAVDAASRIAITTTGTHLAYDHLLVAVGARHEPALRGALTWNPEADAALFGGLLRDLEEGYTKRVAFVVPPGVTWTLPAYELALMTALEAWGMGQDDVETSLYTPEKVPLELLGSRAAAAVRRELDQARVRLRTGVCVLEDPLGGAGPVEHPGSRPLEAERLVALPRRLARFIRGLPCDEDGFVLVDSHGRVPGLDGVWAAGDGTASAISQGDLAAQQADAAAASIAAAAGAPVVPEPFRPVLRGTMLTGRGRWWMRRNLAAGDAEGVVESYALWSPPETIAGRYLAPYLAAQETRGRRGGKGAADRIAAVALDLAPGRAAMERAHL